MSKDKKKNKKCEYREVIDTAPRTTFSTDHLVMEEVYRPMGIDNNLQNKIANLLHEIVMKDGRTTLGELGYLHQISISYLEGRASIKIFFDTNFCNDHTRELNGRVEMRPKQIFNIFQNYLFVGDVADSVTYENLVMPKVVTEEDDLGNPTARVKAHKVEQRPVMVLHCNFPITIAAACGLSLTDPNFKVAYKTSGANAGSDEDSMELAVMVGTDQEVPIYVSVWHSPDSTDGYDPDDAVNYLRSLLIERQNKKSVQKDLAKRVSSQAKKNKKEQEKKTHGAFMKYR